MPEPAAIALGSNLPSPFGTPADNLREAIRRIRALGPVTAVSSFYATAPELFLDQPEFQNAALILQSDLAPEALLAELLAIEKDMGRVRDNVPPKGPRLIDLDLILYGSRVVHTPVLTLPHPGLAERRFVLEPLAEIAPDWRHPETGQTVAAMLAALR